MKSCVQIEKLDNVLSERQVQYIVARTCRAGGQLVGCRVRPAAERGIAGFLGDHLRATLCVKENGSVRKINLFIKMVPTANKPKADFISQNNFFKREAFIFDLIGEMQEMDYLNPWCTQAIIHNEKIVVMPDLAVRGYRTHPTEKYFDKSHVLTAVSSLARFHAAFANLLTDKVRRGRPNFLDDNKIIGETFSEPTWHWAAAKLTARMLKEFSLNSKPCPADFKNKLWRLFSEAYDRLDSRDDNFKVIIHRDLWANNILFQYTGEEPTNALLIDFQLVQYAAPAFDVMSILYLTTSRDFRDRYETDVLHHYFDTFLANLDDVTKKRLQGLNYNMDAFLVSCERARMFGLAQAITIFPFALMEPTLAQKTFDDPDTYTKYLEADRSAPVLAHARENTAYRQRQLEVCEEFVEKYLM